MDWISEFGRNEHYVLHSELLMGSRQPVWFGLITVRVVRKEIHLGPNVSTQIRSLEIRKCQSFQFLKEKEWNDFLDVVFVRRRLSLECKCKWQGRISFSLKEIHVYIYWVDDYSYKRAAYPIGSKWVIHCKMKWLLTWAGFPWRDDAQ